MSNIGGRWGISVLLSIAALGLTAGPALASAGSVSAGGSHSCAIKGDGTAVCWGRGSEDQTTIPPGTGDVAQISLGGYHTCAVKSDDTVACWGQNASNVGQTNIPPGLGTVTRLSAGFAHTCVIKTDGTALCWGLNDDHESDVPAALGTVSQIAAGGFHTCAIKTDDTPQCWGWGDLGQTTVPPGTGTVTQITTGLEHTCAIKTGGTPVCWGDDSEHQSTIPGGVGTVTAISAGGFHTCAIQTGGTPVCWGKDDKGQSTVPGAVGTVAKVSAGFSHTCAIRTAGGVVCWGNDDDGQRGTPPAITSGAPPAHASAEPYSHALTTTGLLDRTLSVTSGALPSGLSVVGGHIVGTPTATGVYTGTISASDGVFPDATQPFSISADVDAPATSDNVPSAPVAHNVTVTLSASDEGWGGVAHTYYTTDGTAPTTASPVYDAGAKPVLHDGERIRYFSVDGAGNAEAIRASDGPVDTHAPTVTVTSPANGATYKQGGRILAAYACSDACTGTAANGAAIDTRAAGRHTLTVTAHDAAGNVTKRAVAYAVVAPTIPPDTTGPAVTILASNKTLKVRSNAVAFKLGGAPEPTTGAVVLKAKGVRVGSATFSAVSGQTATVRIKLSAKAKKALKKHKTLKVRATITVRDATGNATIKTYKVTIKRR